MSGLIYVPGCFDCPTYGFRLIKQNISMASGTIGAAKPEERELCPNDGSRMEPTTWKAHAEACEKSNEQSFRNGYASGFRTAKRGRPWNEYFGPIPDDLKSASETLEGGSK